MRLERDLPLRVLTHNIRYATSAPFKGEDVWDIRKPKLIGELIFHTRYCEEAFICLQEVLHNQLVDIWKGLNKGHSEWAYIGVGRDDGKEGGEYSPIFYRPGIWRLISWETVWLSQTPDKPSRGWDAASIRILTIGKFLHLQSHRKVVAMTTHLDEQGEVSRLESSKLIQREIRKATDQGPHLPPLPVVLAGDFNSEPHDGAYLQMTAHDSPMEDLETLVSKSRQYGDEHTFTGFDPEKTRLTRIDFIFLNTKPSGERVLAETEDFDSSEIGKSGRWSIQGYAVLPNRFEDGVFNSDHRAVVGDLSLT